MANPKNLLESAFIIASAVETRPNNWIWTLSRTIGTNWSFCAKSLNILNKTTMQIQNTIPCITACEMITNILFMSHQPEKLKYDVDNDKVRYHVEDLVKCIKNPIQLC